MHVPHVQCVRRAFFRSILHPLLRIRQNETVLSTGRLHRRSPGFLFWKLRSIRCSALISSSGASQETPKYSISQSSESFTPIHTQNGLLTVGAHTMRPHKIRHRKHIANVENTRLSNLGRRDRRPRRSVRKMLSFPHRLGAKSNPVLCGPSGTPVPTTAYSVLRMKYGGRILCDPTKSYNTRLKTAKE